MQIYEFIALGFCTLATLIFWGRDYSKLPLPSIFGTSIELIILGVGQLIWLLFWWLARENLSGFGDMYLLLLVFYMYFQVLDSRRNFTRPITTFHKIWPSLLLVVFGFLITFAGLTGWTLFIVLCGFASYWIAAFPRIQTRL